MPKIFYFSIPIKEDKIIDCAEKNSPFYRYKEECISIERIENRYEKVNKYRAIVIIGNTNGIVGLGIKASKDKETAIIEAGKEAKLNIIPVRRGYFKKRIGEVHTIANRVEGKNGSVKVQLLPAPRYTGLHVPQKTKKLFEFSGIEDIIMKSFGNNNNTENLLRATINSFYSNISTNKS